jgi:hypothetical protein
MISLLIFLILIGAVLYIVQLLPIDATIKKIIYVVVIVFIAIYALQMMAPGAWNFPAWHR